MRYVALGSAARSTLAISSLKRITPQRKLSPCLALLRRAHTSHVRSGANQQVRPKPPAPSTSEIVHVLSQCFDEIMSSGDKDGGRTIAALRPHVMFTVNSMRVDIDNQHLALKASNKPSALTWRRPFETFNDDVLYHVESPWTPHSSDLELLQSDLDGVNRALVKLDLAKERENCDLIVEQYMDERSALAYPGGALKTKAAKPLTSDHVSSPGILRHSGQSDPQSVNAPATQLPLIELGTRAGPMLNSEAPVCTTPATDAYFEEVGTRFKALLEKMSSHDGAPAIFRAANSEEAGDICNGDINGVSASVSPELDVSGISVKPSQGILAPPPAIDPEAGPAGDSSIVLTRNKLFEMVPSFASYKARIDDYVRDSSPEYSETMVRDRPLDYENYHADHVAQSVLFSLEFSLSDLWAARSQVSGEKVPSEVVEILRQSSGVSLGYCRRDDCGIDHKYSRRSFANGLHEYTKHLQTLMGLIQEAAPDMRFPDIAKGMSGCVFRIGARIDGDIESLDLIRVHFFTDGSSSPSSKFGRGLGDNQQSHAQLPRDTLYDGSGTTSVVSDSNVVPSELETFIHFMHPLRNLARIAPWINEMAAATKTGGDQTGFRDRPLTTETYHVDDLLESLEYRLHAILSDLWLTRSQLLGDQPPSNVVELLKGEWVTSLGWCRRDCCGISQPYARMSFIDGLHDCFARLQILIRLVTQAVPDVTDPVIKEKMRSGCFRRINNSCVDLDVLMDEIANEIME